MSRRCATTHFSHRGPLQTNHCTPRSPLDSPTPPNPDPHQIVVATSHWTDPLGLLSFPGASYSLPCSSSKSAPPPVAGDRFTRTLHLQPRAQAPLLPHAPWQEAAPPGPLHRRAPLGPAPVPLRPPEHLVLLLVALNPTSTRLRPCPPEQGSIHCFSAPVDHRCY